MTATMGVPPAEDFLLPPHDEMAEQAVLGSCLIDNEAAPLVAPLLTVADWYYPRHRLLWGAMLRLLADGQPTDMTMVLSEVGRHTKDIAVGINDLVTLAGSVPTSLHVEHYARIVQRTAAARRMIQAAGQIAKRAYEDDITTDELVTEAGKIVAAVAPTGQRGFHHIRPVLQDYLEQINPGIDADPHGVPVPTGYLDLDHILGGLQRTDLVILAARPGVGKTSMALGIGRHAAVVAGQTVAMFSVEMSRHQIAQRLLSMETDIDSARLREGRISRDELGVLSCAVDTLSHAAIYLDDSATLTVADLRSKARRLHGEMPVDLVIVDYLQLLAGSERRGENRVQQIEDISRQLKALAREVQAPVLALSQLNRAVEMRAEHRPQLSDLRDGGSIEQDADVVLFLSREDADDRDPSRWGVVHVQVAKHRNGATGVLSLLFMERSTRFVDLGRRP